MVHHPRAVAEPRPGGRCGFHGEASASPWAVTGRATHSLTLRRRFLSVPLTMTRGVALQGDRLAVDETAVADRPCAVMWGQLAAFGPDHRSGPVQIKTGAAFARACAVTTCPPTRCDPARRVNGPCLTGFGAAPFVELRRLDRTLAVRLEWDAAPWPLAWLRVGTGGTERAPWFGRGRVIGVEPCATWPATGLARARAEGSPLVPLIPGTPIAARIALRVLVPPA